MATATDYVVEPQTVVREAQRKWTQQDKKISN